MKYHYLFAFLLSGIFEELRCYIDDEFGEIGDIDEFLESLDFEIYGGPTPLAQDVITSIWPENSVAVPETTNHRREFTFMEGDSKSGNRGSEEYEALNLMDVKFKEAGEERIEETAAIPEAISARVEMEEGEEGMNSELSRDGANGAGVERSRQRQPEGTNKFNRCWTCGVSFRFAKDYKKHFKEAHDNEKPYVCQYCDRKFRLKKTLLVHVDRKHVDGRNSYAHWKKRRAVECEVCRVNFSGWKAFEKHAVAEHKGTKMLRCPECDNKFNSRNSVLNHIRAKHVETMELACKFCDNIFERSDVLEEHAKQCEKRQMIKKTADTNMKSSGPSTCPVCQKECPTMTGLKEHYKSKHPRMKLYPCFYCEKAFSDLKCMEKHADIFHADKPCVIRRKYQRINYACRYCNQVFDSLTKYHGHSKEHPGMPMFWCEVCGAGFVYRHSMRSHLHEQHGNSGVEARCEYCSKRYSRMDILKTHGKRCRKKREKKEECAANGWPIRHCDICDEDLYMSLLSFRTHLSRHKDHVFCDICHDCFNRAKHPGALLEHMIIKHPYGYDNKAAINTGDTNSPIKNQPT